MAAFIFFWHTGLRLPDGLFEWALYSCFAATWMSGCLGWIVTTTMPRRLARHGDVIIADEIPVIRRQLQLAADQLALDSVSDTGSTTLAEFYQRRLASFFGKQTHRWVHLTGSRRVHAWLDQEFAQIQRFMAEPEWKNLNQLRELAFAKINTDVQGAGTWLLRRWLFVHIPLTHALIVLIGFHIFWVYLFNAGSI
ncbi:MAG: hypothetical protein KDC35_07600 [Acidobacteria bacterium]|nr:hypothetical protein [Acidobacteriota bacterium]